MQNILELLLEDFFNLKYRILEKGAILGGKIVTISVTSS